MNLPPTLGSCNQSDVFFYTACDQQYFDEFAKPLINSVLYNTSFGLHLHVYNPRNDLLDWCLDRPRVSVTWEYVDSAAFEPAAQRWSREPNTAFEQQCYNRIMKSMEKGNDQSLLERMQKTYYACARFIRLNEIFSNQAVLAIDIDAVVRSAPAPLTDADFYIYFVSGRDPRYLAGGIWLNPVAGTKQFLSQYADQLIQHIDQDHLYWSLDQDLLLPLVPQFNTKQLPTQYIDWNMGTDSCIWTAKGTKKSHAMFVNEKSKYNF